ncbi:GH36-type glycosyl hydrolase domain-containing protein [Pseudactinotalea sp.]|uniref:GH36-type glycosyl hydrolase domain-containing protein n=1 Tax=Pseudactinotalea sp. TaxID=1926260 RepID=UPI003B3A50CC
MTSRFTVGTREGVWADVQPHGGLAWLNWGTTRLNMYAANALETPLATPWLRLREGEAVTAVHPLLGPASGSRVSAAEGRLVVSGEWAGVGYQARLELAETTWAWVIELSGSGTVDVVAVQDVALAPPWLVRMNEHYGAQYIDVTPLTHPEAGTAVAVRQNQNFEGTNPWLVMAATDPVVGYATDLLDLAGLSLRTGQVPEGLFVPTLPSRRLQHEHTLVALQTAAAELQRSTPHRLAVVGLVVADHPEATTQTDLSHADEALTWARTLIEQPGPAAVGHETVPTLFAPAAMLAARDVGEPPRLGEATYTEHDDDGVLAYFLGSAEHVVTRRKELGLVRPHAHLLRTGGRWLPEESVLTTTATMGGQLASYLTQGHVSKDRLLSIGRGYLGHHRAAGLRAFVEVDGVWHLLDTPSLWSITPGAVRWTYVTHTHEIEVTTAAPTDAQLVTVDVSVTSGGPVRVLFALNLALDGDDGLDGALPVRSDDGVTTVLTPPPGAMLAERRPGGALVIERTGAAAQVPLGDDAPLFADGRSRALPWVTVSTEPTASAGLTLSATLVPEPSDVGPADFWDTILGDLDIDVHSDGAGERVSRLLHVLPWFANNALTHYLSPRGIEQYTGGGWGTRDVCQGPVEMLLALERHSELRELLLRVLASQSPEGGWGQAFEIFDIDRTSPNGDAHGDVIFWPILAVGRYLLATGDASILDEVAPFYTGGEDAGEATVAEHLSRAVELAASLVVPGTHLTAYGHGDWNDSLQPANPAMKEGMTSSWTVTLHHQALETLAAGLEQVGAAGEPLAAERLRAEAASIRDEFAEHLIPDGVLAGYGMLHPGDDAFTYLLHPRDTETGLTYSILPMIHAIIDELLTPAQAAAHADLIADQLVMPDGAHLFDRPPEYRGGPMVHFQRAESASFFGREIGTMYTHAHLRYAEAMAKLGRGADLLHALDLINPVDTHAAAGNARRRQATTYFSSSDAVVPDRYAAIEGWDDVRSGEIEVEGGWRVYSSGPGIALRIVVECLLGVQRRGDALVLDPVLVAGLDGLQVTLPIWGARTCLRFRIGERGYGPARVSIDGAELPIERVAHRYREGGVRIARTELEPRLFDGVVIEVDVP